MTAKIRMAMAAYLNEMRSSSQVVLDGIWAQHERVEALSKSLKDLEKATAEGYAQVDRILTAQDDFASIPGYIDDDPMLATAVYWETYFGVDKERHEASTALQGAQQQLAVHAFARSALASALLQFGKQGISVAHGAIGACPTGRSIGTQSLKDVIWHGRNQGIHWEEGNPHPPTEKCFEKLKADFPPRFADYRKRNLSFEVVDLLGWRSLQDYETDMSSIA